MSFHRRTDSCPPTLSTLDQIVNELSQGLQKRGYQSLLVTAASATALLDHCFEAHPLYMRDFDLVLLADRRVTREWITELGESLSSPTLRFIPRYVWPRQRCHPQHPGKPWNAGWGIVFDADGLEVDLSIFHDAEAHDTNGLLNIHRIRLPLTQERPLSRLAEDLQHSTPAEALAAGWFEDPWDGYAGWRQRRAQVVAWHSIALEPIQGAIRIVRDSVQKLHQRRLQPSIARGLRRCIQRGTEVDTAYLDMRNLLKVLTDGEAARELEILEELGAFDRWLPALGRQIADLGFEALTEILDVQDPSCPWVEARLRGLLTQLTELERTEVIQAVALPEPRLAAKLERAPELQDPQPRPLAC